jgi:hypothetical protein
MYISELLPNPKGKDSDGEFIEIGNEKKEPALLAGWKLRDKSGKTATLGGSIEGGGYRVFTAKQTKISLNQSNEVISLLGPAGDIVDRVSYVAAAPEGSSYARKGESFFFTPIATPGAANQFPSVAPGAFKEASYGVIGASGVSDVGAIFLGVIIAACLSAAALWAVRRLINSKPDLRTHDKPLPY